jgi:hypothetical protein
LGGSTSTSARVEEGVEVRADDVGDGGVLGLKGHAVGHRDKEGLRRGARRVARARLPRDDDDEAVGFPRTVRAISKSSIVRAEVRIVFTRALKLVSSGKKAALK